VDCHGNIIPVEINATVVKTGEMLQILTLCRDITERRRADQALRTSEERYRGLFETMQEGFALCEIICDAAGQACDFRYLEANAAFDKMFGIKCDEVLGKTVREVFPQIDGYWIDILGKVALTGGHADFEGYLRAADKHFEVAAFCPQPGLFAAIFTDITDRKRAEEQLRLQSTALEAAANSIIITDSHGIILWVNPAFSSLTGWSRKEVVGKTPRILKSDKQDISFYRGLWGTITAGRVWHGEMINRRKDGSLYTKEMTVTPVRNEHGAIINFVAIDQDITERRRAEEALSASSAYSRSLIEASLDPLVTIGPEGKITDVNAASETATGRKRTELIGTDFSAYFTDPEKARAGYQQAFREGSVRDYPLELRHRDGSVISVLYNATVYRDAAGNVVGVFAAARDITERKRAEEIVRRASAYNRSLLEASLDPLVTIGPDGKITDVNQATELVTGVAREQLIGTNFSDYFTEPERANTGYQQVLREGLVRDYPLTIRHISGRATDVLYNATVYRNEAGEVQGVFAAARDITERKRAEAAMQRMVAIVESSDDAIIGKTLDGIITSWNSGAEKLFGYSAEEIVGKPILALIPPEYLKEEADIVERLKRGESINHFETVRVRKGGQRIDISLTVSPIRDSHGRIIGASKIARDITERKRSEEALQESNRRLQEALDDLNAAQDRVIQQERLSALGAMASGIAHDFNNSLTAILGGSELLLQRPEYLDDKEKTRNYVEMMNTAAQDAGRVVNRLREFYRPREKDEAFAAVNINEVVRQAIALTEPKWKAEAEARSVSVTVHADLQEVPLIDGNATELREALTNLIFNAVDAMPSGGTITIHTYRDDGQVVVQVADTGTGMTEEVRRRCLDPFFTTKGESGSGLGLSMVYGVLQRHQSTVDIETELGRGTTFIIRLPVQSAKPKSEPSATPASVAQQLHILVVDDEAVVRRIVGEYLKLDGHIVEVANSGHDGLEKFRNDRFDLVLVDRAMPDISGDQVATAIKSAEPKVAVVMLTGFGSMMEAADEKPTGVDFIVGKPVTINALRTAISKAVASVN
jgi:PAS domain S-box-containing protein